MSIIDTPTETLRKANQESNETRIKLNTLKLCYENMAQGFHNVLKINASGINSVGFNEHTTLNFKDCPAGICCANREVLVKLGLI